MNSSTLEAHVHNLRVRMDVLSKEYESLSLEQSKLKSRMFREQLKFRFLQVRMQSHQMVDRLPIGRWFIFLCVPLCLAAVALVLSDVILHVRMLSVAFAASTWVLSVAALAVLLSGMGNREFKPQVQHCQDVCMQMQLQAGEIQEAFAGMAHYKCHACAVITNSRFTSSAVALAKSTNCRLIDEECFRDFVMGRIEIVPSLTH